MLWLILLSSPDPFLDEAEFLDPSLDVADRLISLHAPVGLWYFSNATTLPAFGAVNHSQCGIRTRKVSG